MSFSFFFPRTFSFGIEVKEKRAPCRHIFDFVCGAGDPFPWFFFLARALHFPHKAAKDTAARIKAGY